MDYETYKRINGLDSVDVGSRATLKNKLKKDHPNWKLSGMKKAQLFRINQKETEDRGEQWFWKDENGEKHFV